MSRTTTAGAGARLGSAPTVFAIDVGWGQVKFSRPTQAAGEDGVSYDSFPAIAIPSDPSAMRSISARPRQTFDVPVGTGHYEVGHEIFLAQTETDFGREISEEYFRSNIYEALMKGALRYINASEIDTLVLGLPVSQYNNSDRHDHLIKTYSGREIDLGGGVTTRIHDVVVRPQPLGGYVAMFNHLDAISQAIAPFEAILPIPGTIEELQRMTTLIVDPGEFTLDWLLMMDGQLHKASSAVSDAGRYRVVRAVHEALASKIGRPLGPAAMPRINEALRSTGQIKLSGVVYDLSEFSGIVAQCVEDSVNRMVAGLRGMVDVVDLIVVVGGHPAPYITDLTRRFPAIPTLALPDPLTANVRGFQSIGREIAKRGRARAA